VVLLRDIFSHVCGQGSPLVCDGSPLPVCVRCFGLYLAAAVTAGWMLVSGLWRRGLPSWSAFLLHVAVLLAALGGGLGAWGGAPRVTLLCGLWTGHVAAVWLVGGGGHLWRLSRRAPHPQLPWRRGDKIQAALAVAVLAALAWALPALTRHGWWAWSAATVLGAATLVVALASSGAALSAWVVRRASRPTAGRSP